METRILARLLATARTVTGPAAVAATREAGSEHPASARAQVAAQLSDGSFRVLIDGKPVRLALPGGVRPGDVIELRVVNRDGVARYHVHGMPDETGELSSPARLISALLAAAPAPQRQTKPILNLPPTAPAELPEPLAQAVQRSGLFYESHQARWVEGDYPFERLLQEPQAGLAAPGSAARSGAQAEAADAAKPQAQLQALALPRSEDGSAHEASAGLQDAAARNADEAQQLVAREALPFVRSQLDALDARQFTWLGEIWPGQPLHWEIEADDREGCADDGAAGWSTRLALVLPALGEVGAELSLHAGGVRVSLKARGEDAANAMRAAAHELSQALAAAIAGPVHVQVSHDVAAG